MAVARPVRGLRTLLAVAFAAVAFIAQADKSRPVAVVVGVPGLTDEERVDILYLTALGRRPAATELDRALKHVRADPSNPKRRYGDLLWALLNSAEFRTNH
jgi:hypothetical protein